ncbi:hypothetical protein Taro_032234 [Colocasia esculenta]|uniref:CCHC-type domain-containing protein n=1 Tax=Colocasia esculenta TaxID=4460 RepID=A0A843W5J1_COLES|nr:hypothetical protein [Colocasia esculenta]
MAMLTRRFKKFLKFKRRGSGNSKPFQKKDFANKFETNKKSEIVCYECKKQGHMRGECPELKKKLKKEKFTFKKAKAMLATWSDEDEDENSQATSGDDEVQCLMARSDDTNEVRYYARHVSKQGSKDQEKQEKHVPDDSQKGPCRQMLTVQKAIPQDRSACRQHQCRLSTAFDRKLSPELPVLCLSTPVDRSTQCCRQTKKTFRFKKFLSCQTWWFQLPHLSICGHHYISYLLKFSQSVSSRKEGDKNFLIDSNLFNPPSRLPYREFRNLSQTTCKEEENIGQSHQMAIESKKERVLVEIYT